MKETLAVVAVVIVALMLGLWIGGVELLDWTNAELSLAIILLPLGAALLVWLAWLVRCRRRRARGWKVTVEPAFLRPRAFGTVTLLAVTFLFALTLDRFGDQPHSTFAASALTAGWVAIGIVCLVFCAVCVVGGAKQ